MNKITLFVVFNCVCLFLCGATLIKNASDEVKEALRNGARAKIVFIVTDEDGNPISNATGEVFFSMYPQKGNTVVRMTNSDGILEVEEKTIGEIFYSLKKDGYYRADRGFSIVDGGIMFKENIRGRISTGDVVDGKWLPYPITNMVTLRKIINPIPMIHKTFTGSVNSPEIAKGYDLEKGDFVRPYGKGEIADFTVEIDHTYQSYTNYTTKLIILFTNGVDGAYIQKKCAESYFKSSYAAEINALYTNRFEFEKITTGLAHNNTSLLEDSYMVLRTRSQINNGELQSINYSKIYGPLEFSRAFIQIDSYINMTTNSTNLEYEGMLNGYNSVY